MNKPEGSYIQDTKEKIYKFFNSAHTPNFRAREILKYIGPGILVTVGFIDPGNWAANLASGSEYGYALLWVVTLSTIMLILLQHNVAHLGIATGLCLAEAATTYLKPYTSRIILGSAMIAAIATALAEILGTAIALNILFHLPVKIGAVLGAILSVWLLYTNSYNKLEKWIIGFVSIIGLSFLYELSLVNLDWNQAIYSWIVPDIPHGSMPLIMGVLGAVVMPHNLFLHSEVIQSRQWNLEDDKTIERQLKYEFLDTFMSMIIGWAINSAMILIAAATFFTNNIKVNELQQAEEMLRPVSGDMASLVFAIALLFAGIASTTTAGMAGGSIFAGFINEPYDIKDQHTKTGVIITYLIAVLIILFITNPFAGLIISQIVLSIQLPWTIFLQVHLTGSKRVMGKYVNSKPLAIILWLIAFIVSALNILLFTSIIFEGFKIV